MVRPSKVSASPLSRLIRGPDLFEIIEWKTFLARHLAHSRSLRSLWKDIRMDRAKRERERFIFFEKETHYFSTAIFLVDMCYTKIG